MPVVAARLALTRPCSMPIQRNGNRMARRAQHDVGFSFKRFQVNVRLVKTVEQNQPVRAGLVQPVGQLAISLKNGLSFTATGI